MDNHDDNNTIGLADSHMRSSDVPSTHTTATTSSMASMASSGIMSGRSTPQLQQQQMHAQRHQRQNSIPINVDAMKTIRAGAPGSPAHAGFGHRRGISLNTAASGFPSDLSHASPRKMAAHAQIQARAAQAQFAAAVSMGSDPAGMPPASPSVQELLAMHEQHQQQQQQLQQNQQLQQHLQQQRQSMHSRASSHASTHSQGIFPQKQNDLKAASMMTSADAMAEAYLISPHTSVQDAAFVQMFQQQQQQQAHQHQHQAQSQRNSVASFASLVSGGNMGHELDFLGQEDALSSSSFLGVSDSHGSLSAWSNDEEAIHPRRHQWNDALMERFLQSVAGADRPTTPCLQDESGYAPLTPIETPHPARPNPEPQTIRPGRFQPGYDESMEETLKPMRKAAMMRTKSVFDDFREQVEDGSGGQSCPSSMPTPHRLSNLDNKSADALPTQARSFMDMPSFQNPFGYNNMYPSVEASRLGLTAHQELFMARPNFHPGTVSSTPGGGGGGDPITHPESGRSSPMRGFVHRRSDSIASNLSAASIDSLNVDDARIETGIDQSEIDTYIKGPDPADGKWTCSFEDCDKRFGRKENIKSHVQTHLNDRQYQCPSCKKCFVRQHDLKRHAKIHTGIKPYTCDCGNSFARHDALTRHRQRGMCVGAFDGIVKKTVKRGRPRKNRPDGKDERGEKKAMHRKKTMSISSMSDFSACSDMSDAASSPASTSSRFDYNNRFDGDDDDDIGMDLDGGGGVPTMFTEPMAPMPSQAAHSFQNINAAGPSRAAVSNHQQATFVVADAVMAPMPMAQSHNASQMQQQQQHQQHQQPQHQQQYQQQHQHQQHQQHRSAHAAPSPAKSSASHYNTPPDLSASRSSSPPLPPSGGSARPGESSIQQQLPINQAMMLRAMSTAEMPGASMTAADDDPNNIYLVPKIEPEFDTNDFSMFANAETFHSAEAYAPAEMYFGPT